MYKQGKIKAIDLLNPRVGSLVIPKGKGKAVLCEVKRLLPEGGMFLSTASDNKQLGSIWQPKDFLQLVVEYDTCCKNCREDDCDGEIRQLPLKYSQWQAAIDAGEVDSDKMVEFEVIGRNTFPEGAVLGTWVDYAKIILQKKRVFTEADMFKAFKENPWSLVTVEEHFQHWLKENYPD